MVRRLSVLLFALFVSTAAGHGQEEGLPAPSPKAPAVSPAAEPAPDPAPPAPAVQMASLDYARGIEWGGDHIQIHLRLTRQADGTYLADYDGEEVKSPGQKVPVPADAVAALGKALEAMYSFPADSFAVEGNHWFTRIEAQGTRADGQPLAYSRDFYDSNSGSIMRQANAFEQAVTALIERLITQQKTAAARVGLAGSLPR